MSIVQDALKKSENKSAHGNGPKKNGMLFVLMIIAVLALIIFAVKHVSSARDKSEPMSGASVAETFMKPISSVGTNVDRDAVSNTRSLPQARKRNARFPDLVLSGIMQLVDGPRAIINNVVVSTGDVISGAKIKKIEKDRVILDRKGSEVALGME